MKTLWKALINKVRNLETSNINLNGFEILDVLSLESRNFSLQSNMRALLSPVSIYWFNAVLLTNLHCCMNGSQVRLLFLKFAT